ncbi:MAG: hypothetical protein U0234_25815 [Sandaracinus sp.]
MRRALPLLLGLVSAMHGRAQAQSPAPEPSAPPAETSALVPAPEDEAAPAASEVPATPPPPTERFAWAPGGESPAEVALDATRTGTPWAFDPGMHVIGEYALAFPDGADWYHELRLTRAWAWVGFRFENARGRVLLEAAQGSGAGSLFGVAGDSLVLRVREAWVGYRAFEMLELRAGMVATLTPTALTSLWQMRAVAQDGLRQFDLVAPADLGATLTFDFPEGWGRLAAAYYNGDGYTSRELNRGKTLEVFAQVHPLRFVAELAPLTLTLAYQNGSVGTGSARADRVIGSLAWDDPRWGIGFTASYVLGVADRGDREALLLDGWARVEPVERLLLAVRAQSFLRDLSSGTDRITLLTGAIGARIVEPLRAFLAFDGRLADDAAQLADPGTRGWGLRVVVEGTFAGHFEGTVSP